jgi:hypothetical protein
VIKLKVTDAEYAWLEDQATNNQWAADIIVRKNRSHKNWQAWRYRLMRKHIWS